jgi:mono/diheme cytochrome c family protein
MHELRAALALASIAPLSLAAPPQDGDGEPVRDGKFLYSRNCAGCHNESGDGRGPTILELGLTARDFAQGGFAFGDTREAMLRTISTGIPGRSPMPSFRGILTEDEMNLVVDHVRTLMPPRKDEAPANTEMIVRDRPVIARGKLPPIAEGAKEVPRGLLIGTPQGMTFEYDASDVRLLGVRLGRFADRTDWSGRGGSYLQPLGVLVWQPQYGDRDYVDILSEHSGRAGARAEGTQRVLRNTWIRDGRAGLTYDVREAGVAGRLLASVAETAQTTTTSFGPAFRRTWHARLDASMRTLAVMLDDSMGDFALEGSDLHVREYGAGLAEVTHFQSDGFTTSAGPGADVIWIEATPRTGCEVTLTTTTIRIGAITAEVAAQLRKELSL